MQTTITYSVPEQELDGILEMLGYSNELGVSKEVFMNEAIKGVVLPAISDVFINIKQKEISKLSQEMPAQVRNNVNTMVSITTI